MIFSMQYAISDVRRAAPMQPRARAEIATCLTDRSAQKQVRERILMERPLRCSRRSPGDAIGAIGPAARLAELPRLGKIRRAGCE